MFAPTRSASLSRHSPSAATPAASGGPTPAVRIAECGEPMVELGRYGFVCRAGRKTATLHARQEVADRLGRVQERELAPHGYRWLILNAWRSRETLTADYLERWMRLTGRHPELDTVSARAQVESQIDATDRHDLPPALCTGGAVDLALWDVAADRPADLGCAPGDVSPEAALRWFESVDGAPEIRARRRLLADSLARAGFVGRPDRYWRWEFGTPHWAQVTGALHAAYGEVITMLEPESGGPGVAGMALAADEPVAARANRIAGLGCRLELMRARTARRTAAAAAARGPADWAPRGGFGLQPAT